MPLTVKQLQQIRHLSDLLERSGSNYGELRIVYFLPNWHRVEVLTRTSLPRKDDDDNSNNEGSL